MLVVVAARASALCSRRTFKRFNASFHSAEILSVTASGIWNRRSARPKLGWPSVSYDYVFCGLLFKIINYQLWQLPIPLTPPFLYQKTYMKPTNSLLHNTSSCSIVCRTEIASVHTGCNTVRNVEKASLVSANC